MVVSASLASFSLAIFFCLSVVTAGSNRGFSVDLIHRDSPVSPFYDPSLTLRDSVARDILLSKARVDYFLSSSNQSLRSTARRRQWRSELTSIGGNYLMSFYIGTPPVNILGVFDTGSDLTWTQCKPCLSCYTQNDKVFDPTASASYRSLACNSPACRQVSTCSGSALCEYTYTYAYSYTRGTFATETVTFESGGGRSVAFQNIAFGCGNNNSASFDPRMDGIVGFGGGPLSLVRQLGSGKFSYCLVPIQDKTSVGTLTIGSSGSEGGSTVSTPLFNEPHDVTFYTLNLNRISVGNTSFELPSDDRDIIVDSGTPVILLNTTVHDQLVAAVAAVANLPTVESPDQSFKLCYEAKYASRLPAVTFGFTGADLRLGGENLLIHVHDDIVCLGVVVDKGISIFGAVAQQNLQVGFDLVEKKVSFAGADCSKPSSV
ncbi:aspartic proteinase CDR1-like [Aristolochia californica]|uniref:aspartic proteinase CDR1-like n=1 Tax=Aristolochia californica TaxID=171875 RepID=UPI0035DC23CB